MIIQPLDNGSKTHPFPHAIVAGIDRYPSKITKRMSKAKQTKRSAVKPFIKVVNYNHLMPTRYTLELEGLKGAVSNDTFKEVSQREDAKKTVKKALEERYQSGKNRWFFTALRTWKSMRVTNMQANQAQVSKSSYCMAITGAYWNFRAMHLHLRNDLWMRTTMSSA